MQGLWGAQSSGLPSFPWFPPYLTWSQGPLSLCFLSALLSSWLPSQDSFLALIRWSLEVTVHLLITPLRFNLPFVETSELTQKPPPVGT